MSTWWKRLRVALRGPGVSSRKAQAGSEAREALERARAGAEHRYQARATQNSHWFGL